ncbi:hypothetical protein J2Q11_13765 [Tenacibaculum finnmarkense genomovar finnmarkense]|uniref:Uncharacterized protein n=1 Tax=Tenacibaculum finnmarkense genomovar finnmarkense TaxID=1458503 RepID=A0AAP1RH84_9FLAO|nr:type VI secretion system tube protein TssD [Tenacibaculum finnmarkense]MBE7653984.1 hypothetical protein [Tenacibaculum finnmarkense genomovar finnmarkense]MBE7696284.1 hypothetical protein [Tenacibaculum finnmarkense genomovar finnmarkense]MCD8418794.1 hypothetical protein [Tenacibaculum finnmarkense genomovar finnmarkense]MCD8428527.1 hypothetical protein [Tenacibaculum finnmarkense genomovar finnmarkense]MCD8440920.1 hypothetical protein [Tenacibaculum finnmarkense genomovar ulcerans]
MFKVKLIIDKEHELNVLRYSIGLGQEKDITGRPTTKPVLNFLSVVVESGSKVDFLHWMISPMLMKQLELHLQEREGERTRIIYLSDANLVELDSTFSATGNIPMTDTLKFTAAGLNTNNSSVDYSAYWRKTWLNEKNIEPTVLEKQEPQFLGYYFNNDNGEKIEQKKIKINDKLNLIIESEKAEGEIVTINLNDNRLDYKYNGNLLKNDILKGIEIMGDKTEVRLIAIKQKK